LAERWETYLERWRGGGLIDASTAERIRAFEAVQAKSLGLRWPVLLAIALGGLLLGAGVLLFVAAHWDWLSPAQRFALIVSLVALFHLGGAVASVRFPALQSTLHAVGTVCLGAGIFLAGQIFHLQEHWPGGVMLWAIGAWLAWALLRDWPQAALAALLTPVWLAGEWIEGTRHWRGGEKIIAEGLLLLCIAYLTAVLPERDTPVRKALMWIGGLALIPSAVIVGAAGYTSGSNHSLPAAYAALGWTAALGLPLALAWWLRGKAAWINAVAALWVVALGAVSSRGFGWREELPNNIYNEVGVYGLWILGSVGLISWGVHEQRRERINLGVAGFALTVLVFYYSTVMDKLGRAASLFGLGLLFLIGGWLLEKARRRLVAQVDNSSA
jgi:multisubunit Na+/H+ antiporter MnhG subunit